MSVSFGSLLKKYREDKDMTQEELASLINRKKMAISMFERGTNAPPNGELLEKIINALELSEPEADQLRFFSAKERRELPNGLYDYFFSMDVIPQYIKAAKKIGLKEEIWNTLLDELLQRYGSDN